VSLQCLSPSLRLPSFGPGEKFLSSKPLQRTKIPNDDNVADTDDDDDDDDDEEEEEKDDTYTHTETL